MRISYFCICTCSPQLSMFHMERRSRNMLIIIIIIILLLLLLLLLLLSLKFPAAHIWRGVSIFNLLCSEVKLYLHSSSAQLEV